MRTARFTFAALALLTSLTAIAQPAKPLVGRITGAVTTDGLSLPGVTVTVRGPAGVRATVTNVYGSFVIDGLAIGAIYEITAELSGFVKQKQLVALTAATASHDLSFELPLKRGAGSDGFHCPTSAPETPLTFSVTEDVARSLPIDHSLLSVVLLSPGVH
jgi:hypothetical protein